MPETLHPSHKADVNHGQKGLRMGKYSGKCGKSKN